MPSTFLSSSPVVTVTVPEGGVKEGQQFQVSYPISAPAAARGVGDGTAMTGAVTGRWKVGLCDTCNMCTGLWWMSCCCAPIVMGQVMQRLGLDALGGRKVPPTDRGSTCAIVAVIVIVCSLFYFMRLPLLIYILIFGTRYRMYMRRKYNIPTQNCGDGLEDCCCVFWCGACTACQTQRQTHDETQYRYNCCSATGLDDTAPSIV
jgi:Cys-rich protein (TIGR01571 family)